MPENNNKEPIKNHKERFFFVILWLFTRETLITRMEEATLYMASNAVHFPDELVSIIDEAMTIKGGYSSRAEFVRECVRNRSHEIIEQENNKKVKKIGKWP